jgi:hypothetical protein
MIKKHLSYGSMVKGIASLRDSDLALGLVVSLPPSTANVDTSFVTFVQHQRVVSDQPRNFPCSGSRPPLTRHFELGRVFWSYSPLLQYRRAVEENQKFWSVRNRAGRVTPLEAIERYNATPKSSFGHEPGTHVWHCPSGSRLCHAEAGGSAPLSPPPSAPRSFSCF